MRWQTGVPRPRGGQRAPDNQAHTARDRPAASGHAPASVALEEPTSPSNVLVKSHVSGSSSLYRMYIKLSKYSKKYLEKSVKIIINVILCEFYNFKIIYVNVAGPVNDGSWLRPPRDSATMGPGPSWQTGMGARPQRLPSADSGTAPARGQRGALGCHLQVSTDTPAHGARPSLKTK